ncbi:MAG: queuosine precursor transporter [Candidatus Peribacteria bacterium]|nr:queuosine precursor transporter [Candidatus Peribacteria bacterium]
MFLLPLIYSINDVVIEVYGKERMRQLMKLGFVIIGMIALTSAFFTWLPETERFKLTAEAYNTIFHTSIRMSIASLISFAVANILDILIFAKLREKMKDKGLWVRTNVSNIISEGVDTFVFLFLAFYAIEK